MENIIGNVYDYKRYDNGDTVHTEKVVVTDVQKFGDGSVVVSFRETGFISWCIPVVKQLYWKDFLQKTNFLFKT